MMATAFGRRTFLSNAAAAAGAGFLVTHLPGHGLAQGVVGWTEMAQPTDPFLKAGFAPVFDELSVDSLVVRGAIPREMRGVYMRNGPNPAYAPLSYSYPFDGDGMIHALYFEDGRVSYRNRFVMTGGLRAERRVDRALYGGLMRPVRPDPTLIEPDGEQGSLKNIANTNVIHHGGKYLALFEGGLPYELSRELDTLGDWDFAGKVREAMTAHPKFDPNTGEMLMFRYTLRPPYLVYRVVDRSGVVVRETPIDTAVPFMVHDFAVTANHAVFLLCPVVFDLARAKKGGPLLAWEPKRGTRIAVLRRDGTGDTRWAEAEPFFVFHFMNAYDSGRSIVLDYVQHDAVLAPTRKPASLWRMTLHLDAGAAKRQQLDDRIAEFPRVDPRKGGLKNRFGWLPVAGAGERTPGTLHAIARYDHQMGEAAVHDFGTNFEVDEPVLVPRPGSVEEADGWLMTYLYDRRTDGSLCVILDPKDIARAPIAEIEMPRRVPHGLHGNWILA